MECAISEPRNIRLMQQVISALRHIGDDLKIEIGPGTLAFRALNQTKSALPVVRFKPQFFSSFEYRSDIDVLHYQLPAKTLILAFKNVAQIIRLEMALNVDKQLFTLRLIDRSTISHSWNLYLQEAVFIQAVYDINSSAVEIKCRPDVFTGMSVAFKGLENIMMDANRNDPKGQLAFRSISSDTGLITSTMYIKDGDKSETIFSDPNEVLHLRFTLSDFLTTLKICKIVSNRMSIYLLAPGHPIVITSTMASLVEFEIALATAMDEDPEEEGPPVGGVTSQYTPSANYATHVGESMESEVTQVTAWRPPGGPAPTQTTYTPLSANKQTPPDVVSPVFPLPSTSETLNSYVRRFCDESPPLIQKRRDFDQVAEASQPPSDDSEFE